MGGFSVYGRKNEAYEVLKNALSNTTTADDSKTIDAFFTLEDKKNPLGVRTDSGNKNLASRKIKNVTKSTTMTSSTPVANFKYDMHAMLVSALDPKIKSSEAMRKYIEEVGIKLLGRDDKDKAIMDQTMDVRTLKQMICGFWKKSDDVMLQQYRDEHAETSKAYDDVLADLAVLADQAPDKSDRAKVKQMVGEFKTTIDVMKSQSGHDVAKFTGFMDAVMTRHTECAVVLRDSLLGKVFARQLQEKCDAFKAKAEEVERKFTEEWEGLGDDTLKELPERERTAALQRLKDKSAALLEEAGKLKPGTSVREMKAVLTSLDEMCRQVEKDLEDLKMELLDQAEELAGARADIRRTHADDCAQLSAKMNAFVEEAVRDLTAQWQEKYGADGAEDLAEACKTLRGMVGDAEGWGREASAAGDLRQEESTEELKSRLGAAKAALAEKFKNLCESMRSQTGALVEAEGPKYAALIAGRQKEALCKLAEAALDTFKTTVEGMIGGKANEVEKAKLREILGEAGEFARPQEAEDVDGVKARYLEFVARLNKLYVKSAVDPTQALKDSFESGLKGEVDAFKASAKTVVEDFRKDWDAKFKDNPAYGTTLSKSIVDMNRQAVERVLTAQIDRLAEDTAFEVRKQSGQDMVLTEGLKGLFANALETLRQQAEKQLADVESEVANHAAAQKSFDRAMGAFGKAIADIDDAVNRWSDAGGTMVRNPRGQLLPEAKLYLQNRMASFQALLVGMMKSVGGAGMLSSASLRETAAALLKFGEDVHAAFQKARGNPEKLAQLLRALPTPTLTVKTVVQDIADKAFAVSDGMLPAIDENVPQLAKDDLKAFLGVLRDSYASLAQRGVVEESSKSAYLTLAREVYEDVVRTVNEGVAAGKADDFKNGIGLLVREAWGKVSAGADAIENDACQRMLATKAQEVLEALSAAKDAVPKKLTKKKLLEVRQSALYKTERIVGAFARLVAERMDAIRKGGGVPDRAQLSAVLGKLDQVMTWLNGFKTNLKPQAGQLPQLFANVNESFVESGANGFSDVGIRHELVDVPLSAAVRDDVFRGTDSAGPGSLAALRDQVAGARMQAREDALNSILDVFNGNLLGDRGDAETEGTQRLGEARSNADVQVATAGAKRGVEAQNAPQVREAAEKTGVQVENPRVAAPKKLSRRERQMALANLEKARAEAQVKFDAENRETYAAYAENLRARGAKLFLNVPGMESYLVRDADGNVQGWTQDGEQILDAVVREQLEIRRNDAFNGYFGDGTQLDGKALKAELKGISDAQLTKAVEDASRAFEARYSVPENLRPKLAETTVPKGGGVFGLDLGRLSAEQRRGLLLLLRRFPDQAKLADDDKSLGQRHLQFVDAYETNMATSLERAIHSGALRLESVTPGLASLLMAALDEYERRVSSGTDRSGAGMGFGTNDVGTILKIIGDLGLDARQFADMTDAGVKRVRRFINTLLMLNGNDSTGLDVICRRVYGGGVASVMMKIAKGDDECAELKLMREILADCGKAGREDDSWRAKYDPYARAKASEQRVVAMLRMEYAYATGKRGQDNLANLPTDVNDSLAADRDDLLAFRRMLAELSAGPAPKTLTRKIGGIDVTLTRDGTGALTSSVKIARSTLKLDKDSKAIVGVNHGGGTVEIPVAMPLKLDAMMAMLDDAMVANVPLFKREAIAPIFAAAKRRPGFETSSQVRQQCVTFFKSFANVDAAKLCFLPTADLVALVDRLLGPEGKRYEDLVSLEARRQAVEHDMLSSAAFDETLNSCATLEVYRKYTEACKANPEDVNAKVSVPEPERVRRDETLTQSRVRRLHEFAAELIQPNDTTKFDLDRQAKVPRQTIMRQTLLAHLDEVRELLAMDDDEIRRFFSLKGDRGASLNAFAVAMLDLAKGLRAIRDTDGIDALYSMLRSDAEPTTERILVKASEALADSSRSVLENLQGAFQRLFVEAFGKKGAVQDAELWQKSLDELANTVTIDPNKGYGGFLKEVLGTYFGRMSPTDCQRMAALTMRYAHADASLGQVLGGLLKGAGPILQKLMQGLPQSALPLELQVAVEDIKSNLAPIATEAVRAHLYDIVQESNGRITNITVLKSLGAASVGQAFLCLVKTVEHPEGEECVIKLLRPDVQNRARREDQFFQRILNEKPGYKIMLNERFARIFDELDLTIEGANVAQGMRYDPNGDWYAPLRVRSMKMHPASSSTTNVLFLRRAPGTTFDRYVSHLRAERMRLQASVQTHVSNNGSVRYQSSDPYAQNNASAAAFRLYVDALQRQKDMADFITRWTEEVAFGNGFFHGDVHSGNIMTDERGLTVIDYGNASQFTHDQQRKVTNLLVSAVRNKPDDFFNTFLSFLSAAGRKDAEGKGDRIKQDLSEIFAKGGTADVGKRFVAALQYMQNADVELPGELFNLIECMRRLDESLVSMQNELDGLRRLTTHMEPNVNCEVKARYWFDQALVDKLNAMHDRREATFDAEAAKKFVSDKIFEACKGDRRQFEETMADVRKLVRNSDVARDRDYRRQLETLLEVMEDTSAFLDPTRRDGEKAWRDFADAVAGCIVQIQQSVIAGFDKNGMKNAAKVLKNVSTGISFTDAIQTACMRHTKEIMSAMDTSKKVQAGLGFIGKMITDKLGMDTKTPEEKHADRLKALYVKVDNSKSGDIQQMTQEEAEITLSIGRYFALPPGFEKIITDPRWTLDANKRVTVLKAMKVSIDKLEKEFAKRREAGDPVPSKNPEHQVSVCMALLAALYSVRLEKTGFEKSCLQDDAWNLLMKDAIGIEKSGNLTMFLFDVRQFANGTLL